MNEPIIRSFHLGAGRQSTTMALLIAQGILPKPDVALFSDTGREPAAVYQHLKRVGKELLTPAGVPLQIVSHGDLGDDVLSPYAFATIPAYTLELVPRERGFVKWHERKEGRQQRHCTGRYKVEPLERAERELLGARVWERPCRFCDATGQRIPPWAPEAGPAECSVCRGTAVQKVVDRVPDGQVAEVWIGYDAGEAAMRINDNKFAAYQQVVYPLLDLPRPPEMVAMDRKALRRHSTVGWRLADCLWYLNQHGWRGVPKSACYMCPNARNSRWRNMRDHDPEAFAAAVAFDKAFRTAPGMRAQRFLHDDRVPLDEANLDRLTTAEKLRAQGDLLDVLAGRDEIPDEDYGGCSPHGCSTDEEAA